MSTSPKGIRPTDERIDYLGKAKQIRLDKKLKLTASRQALTSSSPFKLCVANESIQSGNNIAASGYQD